MVEVTVNGFGAQVDLSTLSQYLQQVEGYKTEPKKLEYLIPAEIKFEPNEERLKECFEHWSFKPCASGAVIFTAKCRRLINYILE